MVNDSIIGSNNYDSRAWDNHNWDRLVCELEPIESSRHIEHKYRDELLTLFSSGLFIFTKENSHNPIDLSKQLLNYYSNDKLKKLTKQIFTQVDDYHDMEFSKSLEPICDYSSVLHKIDANTEYKKHSELLQFMNYTVIKNLRDDFIYSVVFAYLMQSLFNAPKPVEDKTITSAVNKLNERIEIISTDQVIKITQGLTIAKCEVLGLTDYIWQTVEDDKVRPTHAANNQKRFSWDNPPEQTGHPGTEPNCRCKAKIIVDKTMATLIDLS